ncbi:AAA family ATPase [Verrucomicrobiaceae bacterium 5K15]|uniref:AAA family ATPase n=1 Tax=Oceaniferula flava TaxID=2800421 RepID=A0AAE2SDQ2_9BACT|nr:AAA family ATPase [Oceaniferula flavus]MBK1854994.1 AAA family ATPase [Oceaniferula flavus]MBM1136300.1 AAA family ATPase [Oceaniferula flavus]
MKILRLELTETYKGLENQIFDFRDSDSDIVSLVGLNGSGKSNFLELTAEIFCYLERDQRYDFETRQPLSFSFSVTYKIIDHRRHTQTYHIQYVRSANHLFYSHLKDGTFIPTSSSDVVLPSAIIGYSSGMNENLQRPFLKNIVQHYDILMKKQKVLKQFKTAINQADTFELRGEISIDYRERFPTVFGENRDYTDAPMGTILDYDSSPLVVASLALLPHADIQKFCKEIGYSDLKKISFRYNLRGKPYTIDELRDITSLLETVGHGQYKAIGAPLSNDEIEKIAPDVTLELQDLAYLEGDIHINLFNDSLRSSLCEIYYHDPATFFRKLHKIQLLEVKNWQAKDRNSLRRDDFIGNVRKPTRLRMPLEVSDLVFINNHGREVSYFDLSDGETQLIQILAALRVFDSRSSLFLLDEPDTHLNPHWRTEFHTHIKNVRDNNAEDSKASQLFISTHSPFILSSLDRSSVFHFKNVDGVLSVAPAEDQTFGSSFEYLSKRLFKMESLIAKTAIDKINAILQEKSHTEAREWIKDHVGPSLEKTFLLKQLEEDAPPN